jgi:hypothetical protein
MDSALPTYTMNPAEAGNSEPIRLNPTDVAYLYEQCTRCMYLQAHGQAEFEIPSVTELVDPAMSKAKEAQKWIQMTVGPRFRIHDHKLAVESAPVPFPQTGVTLYFSGTCDAIVELADGKLFAAKYALITDTSDTAHRYSRELNAIIHAIETPARPAQTPPVRLAGAIVIGFAKAPRSKDYAPLRWTELDRRLEGYLTFLRSVARILAAPKPPAASPTCPRCHEQKAAEQ